MNARTAPQPSRPAAALAILLLASTAQLLTAQTGGIPAGVKALRDIPYVTDGHDRQKLDLYLPEKGSGAQPLIIWIHGGGWQAGSKDQCLPLRQGFVEKGYALASIGYRLSGDAVFPAQIEDCKAAIRWLRAHAKEYRLDPARFGVWGSSAGGHLVALVGTSGEVKEFDTGANADVSSAVQAVCDFYGPTDFTAFVTTPGYESHAKADAPEAKLIGGAVLENKDKAARVNPITYVTADDPPYLIVHGDQDPTVPIGQSKLMFEALKKAGVSAHFHTIHGAGHGGPGFSTPDITELVAAFFEARLKNSGAPVEAKLTESTAPEGSAGKAGARPAKGAPGASNRGPGFSFDAILSRTDTNRDGKLAREEFRGPAPLFDRLDTDKDGFVTKEEHERAFPARGQDGDMPRTPPPGKPDASDSNQSGASNLNAGPKVSLTTTSPISNFKLTGTEWACDADGKPMSGILVKPPGNGPFPAILISHGLGSNGRQFGMLKAREFVKMGFVCIATDYTHSDPRGGDRSQFGASAENVRRARACLAILRSQEYVDANRLAAYGNSMGAYLTIGLAADATGEIKAAAITAGGTAPADGFPAPSESRAEKIRAPILILHGTADTTVRPQQSESLKTVLDKNKVPNERKLFEGIGHGLHNEKADEVYRLMREWFVKQGVLAK